MTILDFAPPSLLSISNYDAWRVEFKRCQARATITGYKRDKALLEATIRAEKAAVTALRKEWKEHDARAKAEGRSSTFIKALKDEYSGSASKHKREQYAAEYALKALEAGYVEAKGTVTT